MSASITFHTQPVVRLSREAHQDMMYITRAHKTEVAWFATVTRTNFFQFRIDKVYLPAQHVNGGTVEIEPEHLEAVALEILDSEGEAEYTRLRCWGHSHHTMGTSASPQDNTTLKQLVDLTKDAIVALRTNHRGEVVADVAFPEGFAVNGVHVEVEDVPYARGDHWDALMKDRVLPMPTPQRKWAGQQNHLPYGYGMSGGFVNDEYGYKNTRSLYSLADAALKRISKIDIARANTLCKHYGVLMYYDLDHDQDAIDTWATLVVTLDDINSDQDGQGNLTPQALELKNALLAENEDFLDPNVWEFSDDGDEIIDPSENMLTGKVEASNSTSIVTRSKRGGRPRGKGRGSRA